MDWKRLSLSVIFCLIVGFAGSFFTIPAIGEWYATLNKPIFTPPSFIFSPVWTILYILMGISFYLVWGRGFGKNKIALKIFLVQIFLNFLWSLIFFGLKQPLLALFDIFLLLASIIFTIKIFYKIHKNASYILIPYLLWVLFATILNLSIVLLNR